MRKRERDHLLAVADSMLDGARQLPYLEPISVRRMACDVLDATELITAPDYGDARELITAACETLLIVADADTVPPSRVLIERLQAFRERLLRDDNLTYTVVFMPYNASMWDCLHTIWEAAEADPRVEAIVVPIPYAQLRPDRSIDSWQIITSELPPEVPVTALSDFDLQRTHPDVIYVHNPYDENNRITCVSPDFYSTALRPHTDLMVYVPYYVSATVPAEHLYHQPGFKQFDKVIGQSEDIDQPTIKQWSSNKVVPLGSPKFDYVRRPGSPLPPEWARMTDGKTVLLQVTSISGLMGTPADRLATLAKLHQVLDVVEASEDLMLWWRPHPLEQAAITSMVPGAASLYADYQGRAQRSERVIVDTSADLQRAIHNSDAYYGQWSSIVTLFGFTGKPIVVQDPNIETNVARPEGPPDSGPNAAMTVYARPEWLVYEGAINYLRRMLSEPGGLVPGQKAYFASLTAHADGTAGQQIHEYVISCLPHV